MTSIKVEDTLNEIRYAGGINTALPIVASATATVSGSLVTSGNLTVASAGFTVGTSTGPSILYGSVTGGAAPTTVAPLGSIFINAAGTGPASRLFVNATGASLWVPVTTSA